MTIDKPTLDEQIECEDRTLVCDDDKPMRRAILESLRRLKAIDEAKVPEVVAIGFAQELSSDDKLLLMETKCDPEDIHDNGRPMYRLFRSVKAVRNQ